MIEKHVKKIGDVHDIRTFFPFQLKNCVAPQSHRGHGDYVLATDQPSLKATSRQAHADPPSLKAMARQADTDSYLADPSEMVFEFQNFIRARRVFLCLSPQWNRKRKCIPPQYDSPYLRGRQGEEGNPDQPVVPLRGRSFRSFGFGSFEFVSAGFTSCRSSDFVLRI